jgi:hypothetical protein
MLKMTQLRSTLAVFLLALWLAALPRDSVAEAKAAPKLALFAKWAKMRQLMDCQDETGPEECEQSFYGEEYVGPSKEAYVKLTARLLDKRSRVDRFLLESVESGVLPPHMHAYLTYTQARSKELLKALLSLSNTVSSHEMGRLLCHFITPESELDWLISMSASPPESKARFEMTEMLLHQAFNQKICKTTLIRNALDYAPLRADQCEPKVVVDAVAAVLLKNPSWSQRLVLFELLGRLWIRDESILETVMALDANPFFKVHFLLHALSSFGKERKEKKDEQPGGEIPRRHATELLEKWIEMLGTEDGHLYLRHSESLFGQKHFLNEDIFLIDPTANENEDFQRGLFQVLFRSASSPSG